MNNDQSLTVSSPNKSNTSNTLASLLQTIQELQAELHFLETELPQLISVLHQDLEPFIKGITNFYADFIDWLGTQASQQKKQKGLHLEIQTLALFICNRSQDYFGVNLNATLQMAGFHHPDKPQTTTDPNEWPEWDDEYVQKNYANLKQKKIRQPSADSKNLHKSLYYGLARHLHPDKASLVEQQHYTALMQDLNTAYKTGDTKSLLDLMHLHGSEQLKTSIAVPTNHVFLKSLEYQESILRQRLVKILEKYPLGTDWLLMAHNSSFRKKWFKQERRSMEQNCERLGKIFEHLQQPKELAQFFKEYSDSQWEQIF